MGIIEYFTMILEYPFFILGAVRIITKTLYLFYFWQIKLYRLHRLLEEISRNKRIVFPVASYILILLLLIYFLKPIPHLLDFIIISTIIIWSVTIPKTLRWPTFTLKTSILFFSFVFIFGGIGTFLFFSATPLQKIFLPIIYDIFWGFFVLLFLIIAETLVSPIKSMRLEMARKKVSLLTSLNVIGITGSYGKSSTKEFLYTLLFEKYKDSVLKTPGNTNTEIGIANFVLENVNEKTKLFVCEIGAYRKGEIKKVCEIVKPKIGIITGINEQHNALFGSLENIINAKYELIDALPNDGLAIFNGENEICKGLYQKTKKRKMIVGLKGEGKTHYDLLAKEIVIKKESVRFIVESKEGNEMEFHLNVIGGHNVENFLLALAAALELKMSWEEIKRASERISHINNAMKLMKTKYGFYLLRSTYSSNPTGFLSHLDHLRHWSGKKIVIFLPIIELGKESRRIHEEIIKKIEERCNLGISVSKEILNITRGRSSKIMISNNPDEIRKIVLRVCKTEQDLLLLEGRIPPKIIKMFENNGD